MLQFITHKNNLRPDEVEGVQLALQGGCRWIQLRMKHSSDEEFIEMARRVRALCKEYGATFIVDDRVGLVEAVEANGVHLGKNDMPIKEARKILGQNKIIGATANTFEDIHRAYADGADYIGLGPFRFTTTKEKLSPTLGIEGYRKIMEQCRVAGITLPIVAIGGITPEDLPALQDAGVGGVAISGAILNAPDPIEETKKFLSI